jgi:hypothetical protein
MADLWCRSRIRAGAFAVTLAAATPLVSPAAATQPEPGWASSFPDVVADVRAGKPLVTVVIVPLCSNEQIDCGSGPAGRPGDLATNLYWGAMFGARRHFERKRSAWERLDLQLASEVAGDGALERVVYRRRARAAGWGAAGAIEQIVVLEAVHGAQIDRAVDRFWSLATGGARVRFRDRGRARSERVHVAGYAGHNRLMDGKQLPAAPPRRDASVPSFVMACYSESYFDASLRSAGSTPLLTTRALMAPEGYVIDAMVRGLGDNLSPSAVRDGVVREYAKWQRLSVGVASTMFSRPRTSR